MGPALEEGARKLVSCYDCVGRKLSTLKAELAQVTALQATRSLQTKPPSPNPNYRAAAKELKLSKSPEYGCVVNTLVSSLQ